jgi:CubicO group peptidase (beta-lactamase class C family)
LLSSLRDRWFFPVLAFLGIGLLIEVGLAISARALRPAELSVHAASVSLPETESFDPALVDSFMTNNLRRMGVPAASVAVVHQGNILHAAGYGTRSDGRPVTADTVMPIASLTKSFTALAIMMLVEQHAMSLDAPVREMLPEFALSDPRAARITIRQLLEQTSGLAPRGLPPEPALRPASLRDRLHWLRDSMLVSDPGAAYNYCNDNYNILAAVIERVSDQSFESFMESRIFRPLGMHETRVELATREPLADVASARMLVYGLPITRTMQDEFMGGGGGILSTAHDMARWLVFQNTGNTPEGDVLLSPASLERLHTPSPPDSSYAFGWIRETAPDGTLSFQHSGKAPPFASHERLFPATGYAYAFVLDGFHSFNAEAASFVSGLNAVLNGKRPAIGPPYVLLGLPFGALADQFMALLTVLALTVGVVGILRAPRWTQRRAASGFVIAILRCLPYALALLLPLALPVLLSVVNRGAVVPWSVIIAAWPPLPILIAATSLASGALLVARAAHAVKSHRSAPI